MDTFTLEKIEFDAIRLILTRFCATSLGKDLCQRIGPSRNSQVIRRWLEQTSQMLQAIRQVSLVPLAGVTDITPALERAYPGGGAGADDFAAIASTLEGAGMTRRFLLSLPESMPLLGELGKSIGAFDAEIAAIRQVVGSDGTVMDSASPRLAHLRSQIDSLSRQVRDVIYGYIRQPEVVKLLQNPTVTLHADRYVLPVKSENRGRLPGVVHRASHTGATVFVEPAASVELNNRLADLMEDERAEVIRLLSELAAHIQHRRAEIAATLRQLAQVDLLQAKAQYAYQFEMICPAVSEHGPVELSQARHPLLIEQEWLETQAGLPADQRHRVVPIDVRLGNDFDLLVITGSNTGGKTVTLKTVAILVAMAQSGLHIPTRQGATLPVFHDTLIDIGDEQSLQQSLSTFGAHIKRIRHILRKADKTSLVLLDELGSGTDPDEGAAIGQAVLDELRQIGCVGMVTTHLSILKAYAINHNRVENASVEFDIETLSPTFHLRIGTPGESHAIAVASRLGLANRIVASARKHLAQRDDQLRRALRATGAVRRTAEAARTQAQTAELDALNRQQTYQAKLEDVKKLQNDFETWLAMLPDLKSGDEVFVPSMRKTGRLVRLELNHQRALVQVDAIQVEVPLGELMPDVGQHSIREHLTKTRREIQQQAQTSRQALDRLQQKEQELNTNLHRLKQRARQFDTWLAHIARAKIGDEITIDRKPGFGRLISLDLQHLKATVQTSAGVEELMIQELFPQVGPFSQEGRVKRAGGRRKPSPPADRPMVRPDPASRAVRENLNALLALQPGQQVFVVPFKTQARLIRINPGKSQAVVQSGAFEMELPLSDLRPTHEGD